MPSPALPCKLLLIRHGATDHNTADPPLLQGRRSDIPLSVEGRRQAESTAAFLAKYRFNAIYSSPLLRARQTAETIAASHRLDVRTVDALTEVDVGRWEGMSWRAIALRDAEAYRLFHADPAENPYLGGESMRQVYERCAPALERLAQDHSGQTIAVVAHHVVNRVLLASLLGLPLAQPRNLHLNNCAINLLEHLDGQTKLITFNSVWHLEERTG